MESFEQLILSKPYFDREGFLVATYGDVLVGFAHAAFGPTEEFDGICNENGIVSMLLVNPVENADELRQTLLESAEKYLIDRGATTLHAVGCFPCNPFYLGLYGGSRIAGVLQDDNALVELFEGAGYTPARTQLVLQLHLAEFRAKVDRQQMLIKRNFEVEAIYEPIPRNWWQACTLGDADQIRFEIKSKDTGCTAGEITFWDMLPISRDWGVRVNGMYDLFIEEEHRGTGMATFLICEALKNLHANGLSLAEVQVPDDNRAAIGLFEKLGFQSVDVGLLFQKRIGA